MAIRAVIPPIRRYGNSGRYPAYPLATIENLSLGGKLPINTSGGLLGEAYIHGMNGITEAVRQLRGTSCNQVNGVEHVLVTAGHRMPDQRSHPRTFVLTRPARDRCGKTVGRLDPSALTLQSAGHAVATRARDRVTKHRRARRIGDAILARVPEWIDIISRASERESRA